MHVDDMILSKSKEDIYKFCDHIKNKNLIFKIEGFLGGEEKGILHCLKKKIEFLDDGIYIMSSGKYIPHLLELIYLEDRRSKAVPSRHGLEIYDKENAMDEEY